jgi:peptidyl-prolyl cis-trans isomerase A (cyclophilin A)
VRITRTLVCFAAFLGAIACRELPETELPRDSAAAGASDAAAVAPDSFRVAFETGRGRFIVQANRAWAPRGVDRFHELVRSGFFDRAKFFRVLPDFIVQFGIAADPDVSRRWAQSEFPDDSVRESNRKGTVVFATAGPNTRTTQMFINTRDNGRLDGMGFAPIGRVVEGLDVVEKLYSGYGEGAPQGSGPAQDRIEREGNAYLNRWFPQLDSIISARILP